MTIENIHAETYRQQRFFKVKSIVWSNIYKFSVQKVRKKRINQEILKQNCHNFFSNFIKNINLLTQGPR